MLRYIALAWNVYDPAATAAAQLSATHLKEARRRHWRCMLNAPGLSVFLAEAVDDFKDVHVLGEQDGIVIGPLFSACPEETGYEAIDKISVPATKAILNSAGRCLLEAYWGQYVAFVRNVATRQISVIRDPQGGLPCLFTISEGVIVLFANIEDCRELQLPAFTLDWQYVAALVCNRGITSRRTALTNVAQVVPGECLTIATDGSLRHSLCWRPTRISCLEPIENQHVATKLLRRTTQHCIWAWASRYPRLLHLLSGGLDSSIVLSCLGCAPTSPNVTCVNYYNRWSLNEDERKFARLAASRVQADLIEVEQDAGDVKLKDLTSLARSIKPWSVMNAAYFRRNLISLARRCDASAIFCGVGGDQVFFQAPVLAGPADYLMRYGPTKGFWRLAAEVGRTQGVSFLRVLWLVLRNGPLRKWQGKEALPRYSSLIRREVAEEAARCAEFAHPWLDDIDGISEGKLAHIAAMALQPNPYDPFDSTQCPIKVLPLLSQPLVELCIRVPVYVLAAKGIDRSIARRAFENDIPGSIVNRRVKGGVEAHLRKLLECNLDLIRELMLDGLLVRHQLLDRKKLENVLSHGREGFGPEVGELVYDHLGTEVWLRSWTTA